MKMFIEYCENCDLAIDANEMCKDLDYGRKDLQEWLKERPSHTGIRTELYPEGRYKNANTNKEVIDMLSKNMFRNFSESRFTKALFLDASEGFVNCGEHDCKPYFFYLEYY